MTELSAGVSPETRERTFFVGIALLIALTVVGGFAQFGLRGMVVFPAPILVHAHGVIFMCWLGLFATQTLLAQRGTMELHRRLGWVALGVVIIMVAVGTLTALNSVRAERVPPFFTPPIFLALSFMELATFFGLIIAGLATRKRTDWHRRLMLGAMIAVMGPAWGRLLPMPMLGEFGGLAVLGMQLVYLSAGPVFDARTRGKIHPAYFVCFAVLLVQALGTPLLASTPPIIDLAASLAPVKP